MERVDCLTRENTHGGLAVTSSEVYAYPPHAHAYCEMTLYEPFDGAITVNDQRVDMRAGRSVILMTPLDVHRIAVTDSQGARFIKIAFDEESIPASLPAAPLIMQRLDAGALVCQLFRELSENRADRPYAAALTAAILCHMTRRAQPIGAIQPSAPRALALSAARWLSAHGCEGVSSADAARALNVSAPYLSGVFSSVMGVTMRSYLTELRLRRAAELLESGDMSVTAVCFACGYSSLSHFLRAFHQKYGVSPGQYRRQRDKSGGAR